MEFMEKRRICSHHTCEVHVMSDRLKIENSTTIGRLREFNFIGLLILALVHKQSKYISQTSEWHERKSPFL